MRTKEQIAQRIAELQAIAKKDLDKLSTYQQQLDDIGRELNEAQDRLELTNVEIGILEQEIIDLEKTPTTPPPIPAPSPPSSDHFVAFIKQKTCDDSKDYQEFWIVPSKFGVMKNNCFKTTPWLRRQKKSAAADPMMSHFDKDKTNDLPTIRMHPGEKGMYSQIVLEKCPYGCKGKGRAKMIPMHIVTYDPATETVVRNAIVCKSETWLAHQAHRYANTPKYAN